MREILFRGKRLDNGEWIEGNLIRYRNGEAAIIELAGLRLRSVNPDTVVQFTGLTDKNGKKIFEGEVLDMSILRTDHSLNAVSMEYGAFGFYPLHPEEEAEEDRRWRSFWRDDEQEMWDEEYFTVVGNIYDNPEMLGGATDNG